MNSDGTEQMHRRTKQILASCVILDGLAPLLRAQTAVFTINAQQNVQSISPFIYGVNQNLPGYNNPTYFRLGGDRWTAYNWVTNASNAGSDFNYSNDDYLGGGSTPGGAVIPTLQEADSLDAGTLLTIPINGLVSADEDGPVNINDPNRFTTRFEPEEPAKNAPFTLTPSPTAPAVYEDEFVNWVKVNFPYGTTDPTRPISFELDNEPDAWSSVHPEVHPNPVTYAELINDTIAYATAIKAVEPNALIYGPVNFGWPGIFNLNNASDSAQDGDFINYYLQQIAAASKAAGERLVDVLDVHWYPVTGGLQAPRSLWDPTYTENDYITEYDTDGPIELLPRLQAQINQYYPGTKLSISEYDYGSGNAIAGGIMEADTLGIFGKEGVYSANEWELVSGEDYTGAAFNMYRDYDGKGGTFGNISVAATTSDVTDTSVYASLDSTNPYHMVLVAINKTGSPITSTLSFQQSQAFGEAAVYQLTSAAAAPVFSGDMMLSNPTAMSYAMPAYSVSTINLLSYPTWIAATGGTWGSSANWSNGTIAGAGMTVANFTGNITTASTITLSTAWTVSAVNFNSTNSYTLSPGGGSLTLNNGVSPATITDFSGVHYITAPLALNSDLLVTVANAGNALTLSGPITGAHALTVAGNGTLRLATGNAITTLTSLTVQTGATLDITTSTLEIKFASPAVDPVRTIAGYLTSGYKNGAWTGMGITSSAAAANLLFSIGYADGNTDTATPAAANQVLIKYTLAGDANLDGNVDFNDLFAVGKRLNTTGNNWANGNFNYSPNGAVDFNDLFIIGQNLNKTINDAGEVLGGTIVPLVSLAQTQNTATPLPEPSLLALVTAAGLLTRRRRMHST
jgi:hypothetical protein